MSRPPKTEANSTPLSDQAITITPNSTKKLQEDFQMDFGYNSSNHAIRYVHGYRSGLTTFSVAIDSSGFSESAINEMKKSKGFVSFATQEVDGKEVYFLDISYSKELGYVINNDEERVIKSIPVNIRNMRRVRDRHQNISNNNQAKEERKEDSKSDIVTKTNDGSNEQKIVDLAKMFVDKKTYFFTGAGISIDVIPDWNGLMNLMGFNSRNTSENNLEAVLAVANPDNIDTLMKGVHEAHMAFIEGKPSAAHKAIGVICKGTNNSILTDNRDLVQQNAGFNATHVYQIEPFMTQSPPWANPRFTLNPKEVDVLVVCGMGGDRRGFIRWLKENNPNLEIVHMDLNRSEQLKSDLFIQGSAQETIPALAIKIEELLKEKQVPSASVKGTAAEVVKIKSSELGK